MTHRTPWTPDDDPAAEARAAYEQWTRGVENPPSWEAFWAGWELGRAAFSAQF